MPTDNLTHFVLVDFENRPGIDLSALSEHPVCVTLFLGPKSKLKAPLVEQISSLPFEVRLIKVATSRKNLLDFVLTFHLGEMTSRYPRGRYYIVSGDKKDFAPVIEHLKANHFHVSLHPDIASLPFLDQSIPAELAPAAPLKKPGAIAKPTLDRGTMIANLLLDPKTKNRPTTLPRLHARIKSDLGKDASPAKIDGVVSAIRAGGMTTDAKSKVCYP